MGETAAQTMREIEATRERLDGELRELEGRLPAAATWAKRGVGAMAGVGALGVITRFALRRRKHREGDRRVRELEKRISKLEHRLGLTHMSPVGRLARSSARCGPPRWQRPTAMRTGSGRGRRPLTSR